MKKVIFLLITFILFSCSKKSDSPEITGDWDITFTSTTEEGTETYTGIISIIQSDNNLTGTFEWGGEINSIQPNSIIDGTVSIYCENYLYYGDINSDYNRMAGDLYCFDYFTGQFSKTGTWLATRQSADPAGKLLFP